jgi:hypothetical protein
VESIAVGDYEQGYQALIQHADLIHERPEVAGAEDGFSDGGRQAQRAELKEPSK